MVDHKTANPIKCSYLWISSNDSLIDEFMILNDDFLRPHSFRREHQYFGIMCKNASALLRKRKTANPFEHALNNIPMIFGQTNTKLFHPTNNCRQGRLIGYGWIVELSHHHNHEVKVGEEVCLIEGRLRRIHFR